MVYMLFTAVFVVIWMVFCGFSHYKQHKQTWRRGDMIKGGVIPNRRKGWLEAKTK